MREFAQERQDRILSGLKEHGRVEVAGLAVALGVSEDTVRRDLRALAAAGHVQKTHGGAVAVDPARASWADRQDLAVDEKAGIAAAAVQLVAPGQTLMLDAGSTVLAFARAVLLAQHLRPLTVVTSSVDVALALGERGSGVTVHVTGGAWDARSRSLVGPAAVAGTARYRADWAVLGACALHPRVGATSVDLLDAEVKTAMAAGSARVAVLADSSKHGTTAPYLVAAPDGLDVLVTDVPDAAEQWRGHDVRVVLAPAPAATPTS
ncbi:DeoR/GlpR family DNA-binding transcription regulator [Aquipuribacter hungaricus]|uniref:Lactose phosphotransferase system repressor n=1 Tax=Aquipuribacter hungaricus TaxID=545624 RepID=A0ABV7WFI6_9MICO